MGSRKRYSETRSTAAVILFGRVNPISRWHRCGRHTLEKPSPCYLPSGSPQSATAMIRNRHNGGIHRWTRQSRSRRPSTGTMIFPVLLLPVVSQPLSKRSMISVREGFMRQHVRYGRTNCAVEAKTLSRMLNQV